MVGCNENGATHDSYAYGNVVGGDRVGGLAGCTIDGAIFRSYATGNVTQSISSTSWEGGYGHLTGRSDGNLPGGLGGTNASGSVEDCYYFSTATMDGTGTDLNTYGTSQTSAQLENATWSSNPTYPDNAYPNWDDAVWYFAGGYPSLEGDASTIAYFKSVATGNFSDVSSWERSGTIAGLYETSPVRPDYTNAHAVEILSEHTITIRGDHSEFVSSSTVINGKLSVDSGGVLNIANKAGIDSDVNGELEILGEGTINLGQSTTLEVAGVLDIATTATVNCGNYSTIKMKGTTAQTISSGLKTAYHLIIANEAGVTLPSALTVNGTLTVESGSYSGASNLEIDGYSSPTVNRLEWNETDINIKNPLVSTNVLSATPTQEFVKRSWTINGTFTTENPTITKEVTLYWTNDEGYNYNWSGNTPVLNIPGSGEEVTKINGTSAVFDETTEMWTATFEIPLSTSTNYKEMTISSLEDSTLPVQLSTFDAFNHSGNNVMIRWITESESNLDGYRLYRNNENVLENAIMLDVFISGTNTSQSQTYSYIDDTITSNGIYYYWIQMIDYDGSNSFYGPAILQVDNDFNQAVDIPLVTGLIAIYPNPFNPSTTISYGLEFNSPVVIDIYNVKGQIVKTFDIGLQAQGFHQINWHGRDNNEKPVASGIYFSRLKTYKKVDVKKIMLLK